MIVKTLFHLEQTKIHHTCIYILKKEHNITTEYKCIVVHFFRILVCLMLLRSIGNIHTGVLMKSFELLIQ